MIVKYSIKDLERLSGIKAHTLRAWEHRYKIIAPNRTETNIRYYENEDLKKVLNIAVLVKNGKRISEIAEMETDELQMMVLDIARSSGTYDTQVNALKLAMLEYDEYLFESVFNRCLIQFGTETTFQDILGKFLENVGLFWQVGAINIGNEHFISNLIRQKLFTIIDHTPLPAPQKNQNYLLYLPVGEYHEIGLLYFYYMLKRKGIRVIYLGQSIPLEALKEVVDKTEINNIISVFTSTYDQNWMKDYMNKLDLIFDKDNRFYFTGLQFKRSNIQKFPSHVSIIPGFREMLNLLLPEEVSKSK